MSSNIYPEPNYMLDKENPFFLSRWRRGLAFCYELSRLLIFLGLLVAASATASHFFPDSWVKFVAMVALYMAAIILKDYLNARFSPMKCSQCHRRMVREAAPFPFYVCHPCRKYLDGRISLARLRQSNNQLSS